MSETSKNKGGRPAVNATPVTVRILPEMLAWLDAERAKLDPPPTRPEMIRRLLAAEEDRRITAAAEADPDPDNPPLDESFFKQEPKRP